MGRTNIELDDELIAAAMRRYRVKTKREAVDLALRQLVGNPLTMEEALALEGSGWDVDLESLRAVDTAWS
jgi:Arc/MetJ family transcription regulator